MELLVVLVARAVRAVQAVQVDWLSLLLFLSPLTTYLSFRAAQQVLVAQQVQVVPEVLVVLAALVVLAVLPEHNPAAAAAVVALFLMEKHITPEAMVVMVTALQAVGHSRVLEARLDLQAQADQAVVQVQQDQQGHLLLTLAALVVLVVLQVRLVVQALLVLQAGQVLRVLQVVQVRQGLLGHMYRVTLMLRGLTLEQEMEQHHD
jgi:hypothetical protein